MLCPLAGFSVSAHCGCNGSDSVLVEPIEGKCSELIHHFPLCHCNSFNQKSKIFASQMSGGEQCNLSHTEDQSETWRWNEMSTITKEEHKVKSRLKTCPFVFVRLSLFHNPILLSGEKKKISKDYQ